MLWIFLITHQGKWAFSKIQFGCVTLIIIVSLHYSLAVEHWIFSLMTLEKLMKRSNFTQKCIFYVGVIEKLRYCIVFSWLEASMNCVSIGYHYFSAFKVQLFWWIHNDKDVLIRPHYYNQNYITSISNSTLRLPEDNEFN